MSGPIVSAGGGYAQAMVNQTPVYDRKRKRKRKRKRDGSCGK
jgi:hypothetical protein